MPAGDSITRGSSCGVDEPACALGYRKSLWDPLSAENYLVDFVGPYESGSEISGFDPDHFGSGGFTSADLAAVIYDRLVEFRPAVVLLHIGTNFVTESTADIDGLLDEIDRYEVEFATDVHVIVAQIIQQQTFSQTVAAFNTNLAILVNNRAAAGDHLTLVDMENALVYPDDMYDQFHPTATGYTKMAVVWADALRGMLQPCVDGLPPSVPTNLTVGTVNTFSVELLWDASVDNETFVDGYIIWRDGQVIGRSKTAKFTDISVVASSAYSYQVAAVDALGNESVLSEPLLVVTPVTADALRINAGGGDYLDANGNQWSADFGFSTGNGSSTSTVVQGRDERGSLVPDGALGRCWRRAAGVQPAGGDGQLPGDAALCRDVQPHHESGSAGV
jgi:lysophospholipase L1-like esterase